jgi:anti-sigma factor RsiW
MPSPCPTDEIIEKYARGKLNNETQVARVEEHLLVCRACQDRAAAEESYIAAIRSALPQFALVPVEIHAVHKTNEGSVYLWISESADDCWTVRVQGCKVNCGSAATSRQAAMQETEVMFYQMFADHSCSEECFIDSGV